MTESATAALAAKTPPRKPDGSRGRLLPHLSVTVLLAAASLSLRLTPEVSTGESAGISVDLPERVGAWRGQYIHFCQTAACLRDFAENDLGSRTECPACGGPLHRDRSAAENALLPQDTLLARKRYEGPGGRALTVAIVVSGRERVSIHRPQICLVGQGYDIVRSERSSIDVQGREPLALMVLTLRRQADRGRLARGESLFHAYWFVSGETETPSHLARMWHMASERLLHGRARRWAYITISGTRTGNREIDGQVRDFIAALYPTLTEKPTRP